MGVVFDVLMTAIRTSLVILFAGFSLAMPAAALDFAANPYRGIAERNFFGLRSPIPMIGCQPATVDRPSVELTRTTTILPTKMALLTIINAGIKSSEKVLKPYAIDS